MARPKRGPKGRRVGWSKLKKGTRERYTAAGISRADWEAGADLRKARGHTPPPPPWMAPAEITQRVIGGRGTTGDLEALKTWASSAMAPWWTYGMDPDVKAALSLIPFPQRQWADVILTPAADDAPWTMRVIPKGRPSIGIVTDRGGKGHSITAYDAVIEIPGGGAPGTGARQVMDLLTFGPQRPEADSDEVTLWGMERDEWEPMDWDLTGTV